MTVLLQKIQNLEDSSANDFYNSFHNSNRTKEEFEWEFCNGPFGKAIYIHALTEDGKIIGALSAIPFMMIDSYGNKLLTAKPEDTMVDIFARLKYRKVDIFKSLYEKLEEECKKIGIKALWGFTYEKKAFQRVGFESPFHSLHSIFTIKPLEAFKYLSSLNANNNLKDYLKISALILFSSIKKFKAILRPTYVNGSFFTDDFHGHEILLSDYLQTEPPKFCINQTEEYIKWRIYNNPNKLNFKIIVLKNKRNENEVEVIFSINGRTAFIEQIIFSKTTNNRQVLGTLKYVIKYLKKEGVAIIRFMGFNANQINKMEVQFLKMMGFVVIDRGIPFVIKKIDKIDVEFNSEGIVLSRLFTQGNL